MRKIILTILFVLTFVLSACGSALPNNATQANNSDTQNQIDALIRQIQAVMASNQLQAIAGIGYDHTVQLSRAGTLQPEK